MTDTPHTGLRARIVAKLARFRECAEDGEDVDIGTDWLHTLTLLGLLERTQRSPARWGMAAEGDALLATPQETTPEVEPVAWRIENLILGGSQYTADKEYAEAEAAYRYEGKEVRRVTPLYASPPPSAAPTDNTALVEALKQSLWLAVATLAFHGRDRGTNRQEKMLDDLEELARKVDPLVRAAQTSLGMDHVGKPLAALASRPAAPKADPDVAAISDDLFSHQTAWRDALVGMRDAAPPATADQDDAGYWQHELNAFDRTFTALTDPANNRSAGGR